MLTLDLIKKNIKSVHHKPVHGHSRQPETSALAFKQACDFLYWKLLPMVICDMWYIYMCVCVDVWQVFVALRLCPGLGHVWTCKKCSLKCRPDGLKAAAFFICFIKLGLWVAGLFSPASAEATSLLLALHAKSAEPITKLLPVATEEICWTWLKA